MLRKLFKYAPYIELGFNIIIPTVGILFYSWGVGKVFWTFFLELLLIAAFTSLKMLVAFHDGNFFSRLGRTLMFLFAFILIYMFLLLLIGYFSNGIGSVYEIYNSINAFYFLLANYTVGFMFGFILSGQFKQLDYRVIGTDTLKRVMALFFLLIFLLVPFSYLRKSVFIYYIMGMSIVIAKNGLDYVLAHKKEIEKFVE